MTRAAPAPGASLAWEGRSFRHHWGMASAGGMGAVGLSRGPAKEWRSSSEVGTWRKVNPLTQNEIQMTRGSLALRFRLLPRPLGRPGLGRKWGRCQRLLDRIFPIAAEFQRLGLRPRLLLLSHLTPLFGAIASQLISQPGRRKTGPGTYGGTGPNFWTRAFPPSIT